MSYKRHWDYTKEGLVKVFETHNSACHLMEAYGLMLKAGNEYTGNTEGFEYGVTILTGSCDITGKDFSFCNIGKRNNVFENCGTVVYIPKDTDFTVKAVSDAITDIFNSCGQQGKN